MDACTPSPSGQTCGSAVAAAAGDPMQWFANTVANSLAYAREQHAIGRPIVGMTCEFTPPAPTLAAGALPVRPCGGSAKTISAAERDLPPNSCPLIQPAYGFHPEKSNPLLETCSPNAPETTCDGP